MEPAEYNPEHNLLRHTCSWTPEQRLQWLEDALDFALKTGALEKTRRLQEQQNQCGPGFSLENHHQDR